MNPEDHAVIISSQKSCQIMTREKIYLLTDSVLIDGPDGGYMSGQQLVLGQGGVAGTGTYKTSLTHRIISNNNTLDGLYVGSFVVHAKVQHPTHTHTHTERRRYFITGYSIRSYRAK